MKELSEVLDDCNIQEEKLDEANDTHWEVYDLAVDQSTSADDEDCHHHYRNEVHEEECTAEELNFTYMLELKEVEIGKLQIMKEQIVTSVLSNLSPALTLFNGR